MFKYNVDIALKLLAKSTHTVVWVTWCKTLNLHCGAKPCPDPASTYKAPLVVQWSRPLLQVQRLPFGEGSNPSQGRSWSDTYSPPKWWPQLDLYTSHMLQGLLYGSIYCTYSSLQRVSLCIPPHSSQASLSLTYTLTHLCSATSMLGGSYVE